MKKIDINNILKKKGQKPIICLTAYSKPMAEILDKYCDIILVGDSLGMVLYGMNTTKEVKIETMILHAKTVKQFAKKYESKFDILADIYIKKINRFKKYGVDSGKIIEHIEPVEGEIKSIKLLTEESLKEPKIIKQIVK